MNALVRTVSRQLLQKLLSYPKAFPIKPGAAWLTFSSICKNDYEKYSDDTLDALSEYFDGIAEMPSVPDEFDVSLESGVLTIHVSKSVGTYVINKQAPNLQLWLSSPVSGPKRYDYINETWVYGHDGKSLHQLLEEEFSKQLHVKVDLSDLPHHYKTAQTLKQ